MKNSFEQVNLESDLVIIGAGPAGFSAAVSAARLGMKVILVTDRPNIGGNHGQDIRVGISGAGHRPWIRYSDETGIMHEALQRWGYRSCLGGGLLNWIDLDIVYNEMLEQENNLQVIFNTLINDVELDALGAIVSVSGNQNRSEKHYTLKAPYFADCSGDGTVGYLAGADFKIGREAKSEFNEPGAPEVADRITMGSTLCFSSRSAGHAVEFQPVQGAINFHEWKLEDFPYVGKCWSQRADGGFNMLWWAEVGGLIDQISDAPDIEIECRKVVLGIWDYIKNSGRFDNVEEQYIDWIAALPGKRESRRLMGDFIITENNLWDQDDFEDAVAFTGYMIDVHPANGYKNPHWSGSVHRFQPGASDIPLRSLYSRNVKNLFMAGRNISTTQQAMGSTRVAGTCAVTGQAVAHAAKVCLDNKVEPSKLEKAQIAAIQRLLLKDDCSIHGHVIKDDLLQGAKVSASSTREYALTEGNESIMLDGAKGVFIPVASARVESIEFYFQTTNPAEVELAFYTCNRARNYRLDNLIKQEKIKLKNSGWQKIALGVEPGYGKKIICVVMPSDGVSLKASGDQMTGVLPVNFDKINHHSEEQEQIFGLPGYDTSFKVSELTPLFKLAPVENLYAAENVIDGNIRPLSLPYVWSSGSLSDGEQWLEIELPQEKEISQLELVFNSNQDIDHMIRLGVNCQLVNDFKVEAVSNEKKTVLASDTNNYLRFRRFNFAPVRAEKLRITVNQSWGHDHAEIFAVRAY